VMTAPLPAGISGYFGPELRRFVLAQYHQGQITMPRLLLRSRLFVSARKSWTQYLALENLFGVGRGSTRRRSILAFRLTN